MVFALGGGVVVDQAARRALGGRSCSSPGARSPPASRVDHNGRWCSALSTAGAVAVGADVGVAGA